MIVLGISAYYHDSAATLVRDGEIIAAAQEERFTRAKNYSGFPSRAVSYCLDEAGVSLNELDLVGFYDKPLLTFDRLLETYLAFWPRGRASFAESIPVWVKEKLFQHTTIIKELNNLDRGVVKEEKLRFGFHHHSHAASAFLPSPFDSAAVLVVDGVGEWATTSFGVGKGGEVNLLREIQFPHSLGLLYAAFTAYLGFKINDGEYKVMGLAPYGEPKYVQTIYDNLIDLREDGSFRMDMDYFNYCTGLTMTNPKFWSLFGGQPPREDGTPLSQRDMDIARSIQAVAEEIILRLGRTVHAETGEANLCMAGGAALNCVANGRLHREGPFERIWVQPAAGDAGGSLGIALALSALEDGKRPRGALDGMLGSYLGPSYDKAEMLSLLTKAGAVYHELDETDLIAKTAQALKNENVVGWFQGRMEFGPRALGNRSILGNPGSAKMQSLLNRKIKYRESFRPFAPAVLAEKADEYFNLDVESPYMLLVTDVLEKHRRKLPDEEKKLRGLERLNIVRSTLPAVTHVDYSSRIQTVHEETNPKFHRLLQKFDEITGCPIVVNTSFNVRDEPIVCSPEDAYACFLRTEMDVLVLGNLILYKHEQM